MAKPPDDKAVREALADMGLKANQTSVAQAELLEMQVMVERISIAAASTLLGMLVTILMLFYLVNCRSMMVRLMSWKMASAITSIFCAVLLFDLIRAVLDIVSYETPSHMITLHIAVVFLVFNFALYVCNHNPRKIAAVGILGGHIAGFTGVHGFGELQIRHFSSSVGGSVLAVLVSVAFTTVVLAIALMARRYVLSRPDLVARLTSDGSEDSLKKWHEAVTDFEDDFATMSLGFVISQVLSYTVFGELPTVSQDYTSESEAQAFAVFCIGIGFLVALFMATGMRNRLQRKQDLRPSVRRVVNIAQNLLGMTGAWMLIRGTHARDSFMVARLRSAVGTDMVNAVTVSFFSALIIFVLDIVSEHLHRDPRSLRAVVSALGLWIGLSWEHVFDLAIEDMSQARCVRSFPYAKDVGTLLLFLLSWPAWEWYILPKAEHKLKDYSGWRATQDDRWSSSEEEEEVSEQSKLSRDEEEEEESE